MSQSPSDHQPATDRDEDWVEKHRETLEWLADADLPASQWAQNVLADK